MILLALIAAFALSMRGLGLGLGMSRRDDSAGGASSVSHILTEGGSLITTEGGSRLITE